MANILIGTEEFTDYGKHGQVYLATHDGKGNRLSPMRRSFISFSYGGKYIEDFNLLVAYGDRLNKNVYSEFEDSTSDYETLDGQYYWGTHMSPNGLEFSLATDYMTQNDMEAFKRWFRPGVERELILMEHPNRAILARVAAPPSISMIPYEEPTEVVIGGIKRTTSTTVYKGEIILSFVMDEPYWYGKLNHMPYKLDLETMTQSDSGIETKTNDDCIKIILEDNVPYIDDIHTSTFLGNNQLVYYEPKVGSATVGTAVLATLTTESEGINSNDNIQLFYSGTAPSYPTIKFSIAPILAQAGNVNKYEFGFDNDDYQIGVAGTDTNNNSIPSTTIKSTFRITDGNLELASNLATSYMLTKDGEFVSVGSPPYIKNPLNKIFQDTNEKEEYSYIKLTYDENELFTFKFTTPAIWTGYNQVIKIIYEFGDTGSALDLKEKINELVSERYSRAWANYIIGNTEDVKNDDDSLKAGYKDILYRRMIEFLDNCAPATFIINSKTGEATGTFSVKYAEKEDNESTIIIEENIGDMIRSDYLIIDYKNLLDDNGQLTDNNCIKIESNESLTNFLILYQNMYL